MDSRLDSYNCKHLHLLELTDGSPWPNWKCLDCGSIVTGVHKENYHSGWKTVPEIRAEYEQELRAAFDKSLMENILKRINNHDQS